MSAGLMLPVEVDGVEVLLATIVEPGSQPTSGRAEDVARRAVEAFDKSQDAIVAVAKKVAGAVVEMANRGIDPDRVDVEFGVTFTASGGIVVVQGTGEASIKVTLSYERGRGEGDLVARTPGKASPRPASGEV